uniref:Zinc finger protein 600-like n=1 Tax=Saccoglossus kowalevskii TaxID=10224 RepID=A0ABM0M2Q8_SACKO|nr:PREDICTED: zinc finger protein 600-like [Saccoglossus kowalevskii]
MHEREVLQTCGDKIVGDCFKDEDLDSVMCDICGENLEDNIKFKHHMKLHSNDSKVGEEIEQTATESPLKCERTPCTQSREITFSRADSPLCNIVSFERLCEVCGEIFGRLDEFENHKREHIQCLDDISEVNIADWNNVQQNYSKPDKKISDKKIVVVVKPPKRIKSKQADLKCYTDLHKKYSGTKHADMLHRKYSCKVCGQLFGGSHAINSHMRKHSNVVQYKCGVCCKRFQRKHDINRHMKTHSKTSKYPCEHCVRTFAKQALVNIHCEKHHFKKSNQCNHRRGLTPEKVNSSIKVTKMQHTYTCVKCQTHFYSHKVYKSHMFSHAHKPYKCAICGECFRSERNLNQHLLNHEKMDTHNSYVYRVNNTNLTMEQPKRKLEDPSTSASPPAESFLKLNSSKYTDVCVGVKVLKPDDCGKGLSHKCVDLSLLEERPYEYETCSDQTSLHLISFETSAFDSFRLKFKV